MCLEDDYGKKIYERTCFQVLAELEETELREEREKLAKENRNEKDQYALDIIRPGSYILIFK